MGMDFIPFNEGVEPLFLNWSNWRALMEFFDALGCDMSQVSQFNDDSPIDDATLREWARELRSALADDRLRVAVYPDECVHGGLGSQLLVDGEPRMFKTYGGNTLDAYVPPAWVELLSEGGRGWLESIADFCERAGGCYQC